MRRIAILSTFVVAGILLFSVLGSAESRGPISILGNGDFTEENGVVSGTGTAADPYVIAGWEIHAGSTDTYAVRIENTSAAFVLRGLVIRGAVISGGAAVRIGFAADGLVENCTISDSIHGIDIVSSTGMTLRNNVLYVSGRGLRVTGDSIAEYRHEIDETNLLNDYPILYVVGKSGESIVGERLSHLTLVDCTQMTVERNEVINGDGIQLVFVTDSALIGNAAYRTSAVYTEHGIFLYRSTGNTIENNLLQNNRLAGIQLSLASNNDLVGNYIWANDTGIRLIASDENRIAENDLLANPGAILLDGGSNANVVVGNMIRSEDYTSQGITLETATANRIESNGLTGCEIGIMVSSAAANNEIVTNTIVSGAYGISLSGSYNRISGNLITQQTRDILFPETYGASVTRGNTVIGNTFADSGHFLYTNLDSYGNAFSGNLFLGVAAQGMVSDNGTENEWTIDGVGNYWGTTPVDDADADGIGDTPITVYPSTALDSSPLAAFEGGSAGVGILTTLERRPVRLILADGTVNEVSALYAGAKYERWVGYRGFPEELLSAFPSILFVFDEEIEGTFTMKTVLFDLDIAFFNDEGLLVGSTTMEAQSEPLYTASAPFRYAIELPAGTIDDLGIDADTRLEIP